MDTTAKRTIPQIRSRLHELARELRDPDGMELAAIADELDALANETARRTAVRRAPARRPKLGPGLADAIRADAKAHPHDDYTTIARRFSTNIGRVSEALAGFRDGTTV